MKRDGFTLVELLAVIAILAILVIIALPNVMGMFNDAKKSSFTTEIKQVYKAAQQQWISDSMFNTQDQVYMRCKTCTGKSLDLSGRTELDYYIKINKSGGFVKFIATDGTYQYVYNSPTPLNITDIKSVETVADLTPNETIVIQYNSCVSLDGTVTYETPREETFTIKNLIDSRDVSFSFIPGTTWNDWIHSDYNINDMIIENGKVTYVQKCPRVYIVNASPTDLILSKDYTYAYNDELEPC